MSDEGELYFRTLLQRDVARQLLVAVLREPGVWATLSPERRHQLNRLGWLRAERAERLLGEGE